MAEPIMPDMQGANMQAGMPPERNMQTGMPPEAKANLMRPSEEMTAVLMARLSNMSEQELKMLDSAITPEVARVLLKLLPELKELIDLIGQQPQAKAQEKMEDDMPKDMGALGNM